MMVQRMSRLKKTIVIASVAALSIGGAGIAYAYWTSTGTGVGSAQTGESVAFVIDSEDAVGQLAPGSPGQTVAFTVTNPGPGTQYLGLVTVQIAESNGDAWLPDDGCVAANYSVAMTTFPPFGQLAANGTSAGVATVTLANTNADQDSCQGQPVPLLFTATSIIPD